MNSRELRERYINFFISKGHKRIPSASVVPENDPTVLFTTAGMHPLVPYLLGEKHPEGARLTSVQKCVRTGDIEDVGDSTHNTFFEMLGNWSLGDYFKDESIRWSFEFLTDEKYLGIDPKRLKVTVFEGDEDAPKDEESIKIWQECFASVGIEAKVWDGKNNEEAKIFPLPKDDNWWGPAGITGPCGPDTEIFIDLGKSTNYDTCPNGSDCKPGCHCGRYVEIWNNVFMQYNKNAEGGFEPLSQQNVDTGMGLERTLAMLNGFDNIYESDVLKPIVDKVKELSNTPLTPTLSPKSEGEIQNTAKGDGELQDAEKNKAARIVADHIRTSVFMISDGVVPSNLDRGYILRRLIRRAIRSARNLQTQEKFLIELVDVILGIYGEEYPALIENKTKIIDELEKEEEKFGKTLEMGLRELEKLEDINGEKAFNIFQTYGFPYEMIIEEIEKRGMEFDSIKLKDEFDESFHNHQDLSRTASAGKFKGGLADNSEETTRLHTAAHLLLQALRLVLGDHVFQKGSNITAERLRFDFSHPEKMTDEEKKKVEAIVNEQIKKALPVRCEEMGLEDAKRLGAMGVFESKYGEKVKVYVMGDDEKGVFSKEICGGPHVENTSELGRFRIAKEESSSAGVRRIKAVLE
ncbi:MAG: alanine--tRNA ligase [Candidatus Pacebacteria bacterium]|nr:alanine--tRNA ligase [Candidatus Paceibacterota bacterium]